MGCPLDQLKRKIRKNKVHKYLATEESLFCFHKTHKEQAYLKL